VEDNCGVVMSVWHALAAVVEFHSVVSGFASLASSPHTHLFSRTVTSAYGDCVVGHDKLAAFIVVVQPREAPEHVLMARLSHTPVVTITSGADDRGVTSCDTSVSISVLRSAKLHNDAAVPRLISAIFAATETVMLSAPSSNIKHNSTLAEHECLLDLGPEKLSNLR